MTIDSRNVLAWLPKRRNIWAVWLGLPIITLGIYTYVWYFKINDETRFSPRNTVNPVGPLLALLIGWVLIVPPFISVYRTGRRIGEAQRAAGIGSPCNPWLGLLLVFVFGLWTLYYQSELNKIPDSYRGEPASRPVALRA